jgi:integrase
MKAKRVRPRESRGLFYRNGGWWIDLQINGKRYREYAGPTEAQAKIYRNKLLAWKRDVHNGLPAVKPEGEVVRFDKHADDFLSLYARRKRSYERDVRSMDRLKEFFKGRALRDINAEAVVRFRAKRAEDGLSAASINRELACLRTALRKAVEWGKLPAYPLPTEKLLEKETEFKPRVLEPDESARIVRAADLRWLRPAIVVWLNTGLRKMELLKLRRSDVDLKKRTLTVAAANAKNGKERTMPINQLVAGTLVAMPGETFFFESRKGVHLGPSTLNGPFKKAVEDAGIKDRVRIHDLRDTFASRLLRGDDENSILGVDIRTVAELIGDTPEVALKRYCHTNEKTMRAAVDKATALMFGSRQKVHETPVEDMEPACESIS